MTEVADVPAEAISSDALSLFDLFRETFEFEIKDNRNRKMKVCLRSLNAIQNSTLIEDMAAHREIAKAEIDTPLFRQTFAAQLKPLTDEQVVDLILTMEEPTAAANIDLAPGVEDPEETPDDEAKAKSEAEREKAALERWRTERKAELEALDGGRDVLDVMAIERQIALLTQARIATRFMDHQLVLMVVDPATQQPMLSLDPKAKNFIGALMPEVKQAIMEQRNKFAGERDDQALRKTAKKGPFSRRGRSRGRPTGSPGETTETPSTSRPTSQPSTTSASG